MPAARMADQPHRPGTQRGDEGRHVGHVLVDPEAARRCRPSVPASSAAGSAPPRGSARRAAPSAAPSSGSRSASHGSAPPARPGPPRHEFHLDSRSRCMLRHGRLPRFGRRMRGPAPLAKPGASGTPSLVRRSPACTAAALLAGARRHPGPGPGGRGGCAAGPGGRCLRLDRRRRVPAAARGLCRGALPPRRAGRHRRRSRAAPIARGHGRMGLARRRGDGGGLDARRRCRRRPRPGGGGAGRAAQPAELERHRRRAGALRPADRRRALPRGGAGDRPLGRRPRPALACCRPPRRAMPRSPPASPSTRWPSPPPAR